MIKERVLFTDAEADTIEEAYVISGQMALSIYDDREWIFRSISGFRGGTPVVDLHRCETFCLTMKIPADIAVDDVLSLTAFDLARIFAL